MVKAINSVQRMGFFKAALATRRENKPLSNPSGLKNQGRPPARSRCSASGRAKPQPHQPLKDVCLINEKRLTVARQSGQSRAGYHAAPPSSR
jgi:hypothetical protein